MRLPLRVLIIEDSPDDSELILDELRRGGYEPVYERVETATALEAALKRQEWEIVVSDYRLPDFSGLAALEIVRSVAGDIPFILVTGTIGDEQAVQAIKRGANDYLIKDRLGRLGSAVEHELENRLLRGERRKTAEELRLTHGQLRRLLGHSPAVIYSLKVEGETVTPQLVSENFTRLLGFAVEECSYDWWGSHVHPEDQARAFESIAETLRRGEMTMEYRIRSKDGQYRWVEDSRRVIHDPAGQPIEIAGVWTDITERIRGEAALRSSEERFRQLAENIQDVFWVSDGAMEQVLYVSPAYEVIWARSCHSLCVSPHDWLESIHPENREAVVRAVNNSRSTGMYDAEYRIIRPDGSIRWIQDHGFPVRDAGGNIYRFTGVARDITGRKQAEELLRENEEKYRNLVELSPEGILIHQQGHVVFANQVAARLLKAQDPASLLGLPILDLVHPDSRSLKMDRIALALNAKGALPTAEERLLRRDGSAFEAEVVTAPFPHEGRMAVLLLIRDITERKVLQEKLLRNQRLESIGTLAGGVAHDLNNVLAPILMSAELLRVKLPDERSQKILSTISASAERGAELIKQVLAFSQGIQGGKAPLQLRHVIRETQSIAKQAFPKSVHVRFDPPSDLWTIEGDATQMHQVMMNLCVNARDAMPNGGEIVIDAENLFVDETFAKMNPDAKCQPYVVVTVSDTGTGMPPETRARIFEPFFTTKETGKGTGLGLSTVLGIVKGHAGFVTVYSEVGVGSRFKIYLPASSSREIEQRAKEPELLPAGQGELILLVDDEQAIREIAQETLTALGYQVLTASDGAEAVACGAQHAARLKLLLTDMMMPIMDGPATIRAMKRIVPALKVIAASGLDSGGRELNPSKFGADAFLHKPFTAATLARKVHEVLSGGG